MNHVSFLWYMFAFCPVFASGSASRFGRPMAHNTYECALEEIKDLRTEIRRLKKELAKKRRGEK